MLSRVRLSEEVQVDQEGLDKLRRLANDYHHLILNEDSLNQENATLRHSLNRIRNDFEARYRALESALTAALQPLLPPSGDLSLPSSSSSSSPPSVSSSVVPQMEEEIRRLRADKSRLETNVSMLSGQLAAEQGLAAKQRKVIEQHQLKWQQLKEAAKQKREQKQS